MNILADVKVYIQKFKWDDMKYPRSRALNDIATQIGDKMKAIDADIKKQMDDFQETKSAYAQLARQEGSNFITKDLSEVIYGKVKKELFVETEESEFLATMIAVVHKSKEKEFTAQYEKIMDQVVVPKSARDLGQEDKDGHRLFRFVIFQHSVEQFSNESRKQGFICKRFLYNKEQYDQDE